MSTIKVKTLNGIPLKIGELNTGTIGDAEGHPLGFFSKIARAYKNFSLVLAGMYTGVGCSGTPNPFHNYEHNDPKHDGHGV